jgi:predicted ester cyclase
MKIQYLTFVLLIIFTFSCKNNSEGTDINSDQTENNSENNKLTNFGNDYTNAWNSQTPENVASFFAIDGSLTVNEGQPIVGRDSIAKFANSFMTAFPDMKLSMDSLVIKLDETQFHWSFIGTNTGPKGTGNKVVFNGFERWTFDDKGLIKASRGNFDKAEFQRQLKGDKPKSTNDKVLSKNPPKNDKRKQG